MNDSQVWVIVTIVVLAVVLIMRYSTSKNKKDYFKISTLASFAFAFILAGLIFSTDRLISYSLFGVGVALAIIDMIKKSKK